MYRSCSSYSSIGGLDEPLMVCTILASVFGSLTINSSSEQSSASQIRSRWSKFTLSTISWYNSLIVVGRMPVFLARSACVHFRSPNREESKILIIRHCSFRYNLPFFDRKILANVRLSRKLLLFYTVQRSNGVWFFQTYSIYLFIKSCYAIFSFPLLSSFSILVFAAAVPTLDIPFAAPIFFLWESDVSFSPTAARPATMEAELPVYFG